MREITYHKVTGENSLFLTQWDEQGHLISHVFCGRKRFLCLCLSHDGERPSRGLLRPVGQ